MRQLESTLILYDSLVPSTIQVVSLTAEQSHSTEHVCLSAHAGLPLPAHLTTEGPLTEGRPTARSRSTTYKNCATMLILESFFKFTDLRSLAP